MVGEAALAAWLASAMPITACAPKLDLTVIAAHLPPTVQSTYGLDEIRSLAARSGRPLRHEAFGFYLSTFGYRVAVDHRKVAGADCGMIAAEVRLVLGGRLIEIASDLEHRSCRREVILSHYMLHAQYDDVALSAYANRALKELQSRPDAQLLGDPGQGDIQDAAATAIKQVMDEVLRSFDQDRQDALAAADNDDELRRLSGVCGRAL